MEDKMATEIPRIIHQIWIGDQTKRPTQLMDKVKELHPDWEYKVWTEDELALEILDESVMKDIIANSTKPDFYAKVADIARYIILHKYGGFYLDADTEILKPLDNLRNKGFVACFEINNVMVSNGVIGSVPAHGILTFCNNVIRGLYIRNRMMVLGQKAWKITGPKLFTTAINFCKDEPMDIMDHKAFLPIHHSDFDTSAEYDELHSKIGPDSYATTRWGHKDMYKVKSDRQRFIKYLKGQIQWLQQSI